MAFLSLSLTFLAGSLPFSLLHWHFLSPVPLQQCEGESLVSELVRLVDEKGLAFGLKVVGVVTLALVLREGGSPPTILVAEILYRAVYHSRHRKADADDVRAAGPDGTEVQADFTQN
ncbi:hypothetical protein DTO027I6_683 [Penicillium roqueforti]|nr:hypothetical protein CBS147332_9380 [Penicillium roqueforti]KAI3094545.1 hypothetical protein CBS147331_9628 [Penicillium roqueforti]KAI3221783.1 hypothetical protein DTO027I6_683 [Penicillium roqueforti]